MHDKEPVPTFAQVELDVRLDDEGRPFVDAPPTVPDDVQEEDLP